HRLHRGAGQDDRAQLPRHRPALHHRAGRRPLLPAQWDPEADPSEAGRPATGAVTMWYAIIARDHADALPRRLQARPDHLARLEELKQQGRLLLAGPMPAVDSEDPGPAGFLGSLVVASFESLEQARAWADADPYVAANVYHSVEVLP